MTLSRIWRILQVKESVIQRGRRPRWIAASEICRIFDILRKPNLIIALLFTQNILFAQTCKLYSRPFLSLLNDTTLRPGFLGQWFNNLWRRWFNNLQRAALLTSFWRQWFNNLQRTAFLTFPFILFSCLTVSVAIQYLEVCKCTRAFWVLD